MLPFLLTFASGFVQGPPWAHFSRTQLLRGVVETVEIGSGPKAGAPNFRYTLKLTRRQHGTKPISLWADSATCPAIRPIIAAMTKVAMPHPAPYGVPGVSQEIVVDGVEYELSAPSTDVMGVLTIKSNEGSPLSHWVDDALEQLASCWSPATSQ